MIRLWGSLGLHLLVALGTGSLIVAFGLLIYKIVDSFVGYL